MKTKLKLVFRKLLKALLATDRRFIRLLGGQKQFNPQPVDHKLTTDQAVEYISEMDRKSFEKFKLFSRPPILARGYIFIRNKLFILAYRAGKRLVR